MTAAELLAEVEALIAAAGAYLLDVPIIYNFAPGVVYFASQFSPAPLAATITQAICIWATVPDNPGPALTPRRLIANITSAPPTYLGLQAVVITRSGYLPILEVTRIFDYRPNPALAYVCMVTADGIQLPAIPAIVDPSTGLLVFGRNASGTVGTPGVLSLSQLLALLRALPVEQQDAALLFQFGSQTLTIDVWRQYPQNNTSPAKATVLMPSVTGLFAGHYTPRTLADRLGPTEADNGDGPVFFQTQSGQANVQGLRVVPGTPGNPLSFPRVLLTAFAVLPAAPAGGPGQPEVGLGGLAPSPPPFVDP